MRRVRTGVVVWILTLGMIAMVGADEGKKEEEAAPLDFRVYWKDGIRFDSGDGNFKFKFGGRIMNDWVFHKPDNDLEAVVGNIDDGTEFRRARLYFAGEVYGNVAFKAQYDFAGQDADFKDVYIGLKEVPHVGTVKIGHFKEPFSIEEATSSKYITFMERSLAATFSPSRNTGIAIGRQQWGNKITWGVGVFKDVPDSGNSVTGSDGDWAATGRIAIAPVLEDGGAKLVHVGLGVSTRSPNSEVVRYRARPEAHLAPRFVDTGSFAADDVLLLGLEFAGTWGPASVQAELTRASVDSNETNDPTFTGFYLYASYFLTGEYRPYKRGAFSRVKPKANMGGGGWGAWEVAARISNVDLKDAAVDGGSLQDFTLGVNWYLNPNTRVMLNFVNASVDHDVVGLDNESDNVVMVRFQIDF